MTKKSGDLLLEIGTEEIPARFLPPAVRQLEDGAKKLLADRRISSGGVSAYATPTRLVLHAQGVADAAETRVIERAAGRTLVSYRIAVGPFSFRFFLNNYADAETHFLRWELDQSRDNDLFREHWGYWKVDEWDDGALVTYAMAGQTTLPAFMMARAGRDGTVETVKALKAHVEQRAGL